MFFKKLKIVGPCYLTPEHISGENHDLKDYTHPTVHRHTVYNSQDTGATHMSVDRGMDKEAEAHIYNALLLSHYKE